VRREKANSKTINKATKESATLQIIKRAERLRERESERERALS